MESEGLNHWESDWDEEGGGLATTSTKILAKQLCSSMEPRTGLILTREFNGVQLCLILWALEPFCPCPSKEPNHNLTHS